MLLQCDPSGEQKQIGGSVEKCETDSDTTTIAGTKYDKSGLKMRNQRKTHTCFNKFIMRREEIVNTCVLDYWLRIIVKEGNEMFLRNGTSRMILCWERVTKQNGIAT